ncbi:MAG TPA: N-acetyltransferase [Candidatus Cloacimonetes bacterium]|nr:N-acetyltransferase [Candidatus Cloacimonadota bacterium]
MIEYFSSIKNIKPSMLEGFFAGWSNPPSREKHLKILKNSFTAEIAFDTKNDKVVGFVNALSDGILYAFIPLLEVLPEYQGKGIGKELIKRIEKRLKRFYALDIVCDDKMAVFYHKLGYFKLNGMVKRNYK